MPDFPTTPVALALLAVSSLAFMGVIALAFVRAPRETGGARDGGSRVGIALQGMAIGLVFAGRPIMTAAWALPQIAAAVAVALLGAASVALFVWAKAAMGRNWSIVARTRDDHRLVTTGPFAFVRNPIYLAMALFMIAGALGTGHVRMLAIAAPVFAIGTAIRVRIEERLLHAHFGAHFDTYARRVKRVIPYII